MRRVQRHVEALRYADLVMESYAFFYIANKNSLLREIESMKSEFQKISFTCSCQSRNVQRNELRERWNFLRNLESKMHANIIILIFFLLYYPLSNVMHYMWNTPKGGKSLIPPIAQSIHYIH